MIITYIYSNRLEDQIRIQLRVRNFVDAINRTGYHHAGILNLEAFVENTQEAERVCARSDLLIIYRYLFGSILATVQYWKLRGKRIIVDFDQAIDTLTPIMPDYPLWHERASVPSSAGKDAFANSIHPVPFEQFKWGLGLIDAATVPTARLAHDWTKLTTTYEIPDYINTCQYPTSDRAGDDDVWIGLSHAIPNASLKESGLATAMENICKKYPQVRLVLPGEVDRADASLDIDRKQMVVYSPSSFDQWVNLLLNLDIGLAPVCTGFDLRLSSVHLLEFMIVKMPWIASRLATHHSLSRYGVWVQNSAESWENAVSRMLERLHFYRKKARGEPFLYALGQDISVNIDKAIRVYSAIINQPVDKVQYEKIRP